MGRRRKSTPKKVLTRNSNAKNVKSTKGRKGSKSQANNDATKSIEIVADDSTLVESKNKWWTKHFDEKRGDSSKVVEYTSRVERTQDLIK